MNETEAAGAAVAAGGLDIPKIIDRVGTGIYFALALLAVWGVYNAIVLYRTLKKKGIDGTNANSLVRRVHDALFGPRGADIEAAVSLCQNPPYWHTALAQLVAVALRNRDRGLAKVKQMLVMEFHTEIVSGMEGRLASISTIVRMGPLLGLLGTVASMIAAFGRIGGAEKVNPSALASDISLALWATAAGLVIATAMMIVANDIHNRLRKLRDRTERQLQEVVELLEKLDGPPAAPAPRAGAGTGRAVLPR
jgi:biopolymer transport protein ExbB